MNKELEALEDLQCYALGSYELEEDCYDNEKHYNFVQEEYKIIKSALEQKEKLKKFVDIFKKYDFRVIEYCKYNTYEELVEFNNRLFIKFELPTEEEFNLIKEISEEK